MDIRTRERLFTLMALVADINGTEDRLAENNEPCIFLDWSGHVSMVDIRIFLKGWSAGAEPDWEYRIGLDDLKGDHYGNDNIEDVITMLRLLKEDI